MWLRLLLPLLAAGSLAWQASPPAEASGSVTRPCGTLSIGIGWHVRSSANVRCSSARVLITSYFKRRGNRQAVIVVSGVLVLKARPCDRCADPLRPGVEAGHSKVLRLLTLRDVSQLSRAPAFRNTGVPLESGRDPLTAPL
jgi:hypothetical protein